MHASIFDFWCDFCSGLATNSALTAVENKMPDVRCQILKINI